MPGRTSEIIVRVSDSQTTMPAHSPNDDAKSLPAQKNDPKPILINNSFTLSSFLGVRDRSSCVNSLTSDQQSMFASFKRGLGQNPELLDFVSGVSGGVLATTTLHPLDVLKIRLAGTILNRSFSV